MGISLERARICIEMDVSLAKPPKIHVRLGSRDLWLPCRYEEHTPYCGHCKRFGHPLSQCRKRHPSVTAPAAGVGQQGAGEHDWKRVTRKRQIPKKLSKSLPPPTSQYLKHIPLLATVQQLSSKPTTHPSTPPSHPNPPPKPVPNPPPLVVDTLVCPSTSWAHTNPMQTPSPQPPSSSFPPDLSFLQPSSNPCKDIIPFLPPPCPTLLLKSRDDIFTKDVTLSWENLHSEDEVDEEISPVSYHSDGELGAVPFISAPLAPLEMVTHQSPRVSMPLQPSLSNTPAIHPDTWDGFPTTGGMRGMANKLQAMKKALRTWNKLVFGNTHSNLIAAEEAASQTQADFELNPTEQNREAMQQANAKFILATNLEVQYWKQKANIKWMDKGDSNSKLFQAFVKGKRKKLTISHIIGSNGKGYYNLDDIKKAVSYFTNTFKKTHHPSVDPILPLIPLVLSPEDNSSFTSLPTLEEVKQAVWDLDDTSVGGPDGFNGKFFKTTWDTIKLDVLSASQEFFLGVPIPKAYGSTLLTLIPKTENSKKFDDFRPISLSTFMSKINTKLLANRSSIFLPKLLSPEQAAFQKGKSIDDNVLMAEEAFHLLDKKVLNTYMANFLWGQRKGKPKYHWKRWEYITKPEAAGGLGLKNIEDLQQAYTFKLWWKANHDTAATCFEEMYRQDPSLHPDGLMGGIDHSRVLSAVPLRTLITVVSSSRVPRPKGKKLKTVKNQKAVKGQIQKSSPVTVFETGPITSTGCLLLDVDFDEALRFVGEGYSVRRPHATNHVLSVTSRDAEVGVHVASMRYGLRFPPHDLIVQFLNFYRLLAGQLSPHSYYCFLIFLIKCHLKGVPWSLDLFRYMFKVSKVGAREGNSYAVVSSQAECGMAVIPTSLKLWKAKFVFLSGFPGDRHPFQARFPDYHTFIRHPRPNPTPELLAHAPKLLEGCRPNPPHVYTVCTEQNLAKVGILISLERQFELAEASLGSRPKHRLEESTSRPVDPESEEREEEEDGEVKTDEESGQSSCSEDVVDVEPFGGDMHPLEVVRRAKLLAQSQGREEEVHREPPSGNTSGFAATIPTRKWFRPGTKGRENFSKPRKRRLPGSPPPSSPPVAAHPSPEVRRLHCQRRSLLAAAPSLTARSSAADHGSQSSSRGHRLHYRRRSRRRLQHRHAKCRTLPNAAVSPSPESSAAVALSTAAILAVRCNAAVSPSSVVRRHRLQRCQSLLIAVELPLRHCRRRPSLSPHLAAAPS
ncbi:unnamed protein product [Cuscuta campestris]|uniref:Transposase (putative) gypsy type domain-containing protein n=1 Tax=Cuscuta campestris TaxID=132261 RepID=A0A484MWS7_9ASTE|nr:unnamed protein product [Cuscuta campestris]